MQKRIYLASIYSLDAKDDSIESQVLRAIRARYVMKQAAKLMQQGYIVYCPIAHCHQLGVLFDLPKDFTFWKQTDHSFINTSDAVFVLEMKTKDGKTYEYSEGITSEIEHAKEHHTIVETLDCDDYDEQAEFEKAMLNYESGYGCFPSESEFI